LGSCTDARIESKTILHISCYTPTGQRLSIRSRINADSPIALSTKYCFAKFGSSDSMESVNCRAHKMRGGEKDRLLSLLFHQGITQLEVRFSSRVLCYKQRFC
jgi:hypothetical protein